MVEAHEALDARGLRATPQRIAIYEALLPRKDHPDVDMLYQEIHGKYPTISLNTVYNTLVTLEKAGLIRRIDAGDGRYRYDGNPEIHAHAVCTTCQRVDDVPLGAQPDMPALIRAAEKTARYTIADTALYFYGRCPQCSRKT